MIKFGMHLSCFCDSLIWAGRAEILQFLSSIIYTLDQKLRNSGWIEMSKSGTYTLNCLPFSLL